MSTPEITTADLAAALAQDHATVVDVREPDEYAEAHVPGARSIPLGQLSARLDEVPRAGRVHVVCASGNRSRVGADLLNAAGHDAVSVTGGTSGWIRAGHPVASGAQPA